MTFTKITVVTTDWETWLLFFLGNFKIECKATCYTNNSSVQVQLLSKFQYLVNTHTHTLPVYFFKQLWNPHSLLARLQEWVLQNQPTQITPLRTTLKFSHHFQAFFHIVATCGVSSTGDSLTRGGSKKSSEILKQPPVSLHDSPGFESKPRLGNTIRNKI